LPLNCLRLGAKNKASKDHKRNDCSSQGSTANLTLALRSWVARSQGEALVVLALKQIVEMVYLKPVFIDAEKGNKCGLKKNDMRTV